MPTELSLLPAYVRKGRKCLPLWTNSMYWLQWSRWNEDIVTYLGVCVTYRRVLDWWPDLLHTYTTCYYTSQTTIWHTMSSLLHHLRLPIPEIPSIIPQLLLNFLILNWNRSACLGSSLYPQKTLSLNNSSIVGRCCGNVFTKQLPRNVRLLWLHYSGLQESRIYTSTPPYAFIV
jgi:hypothetical protein